VSKFGWWYRTGETSLKTTLFKMLVKIVIIGGIVFFISKVVPVFFLVYKSGLPADRGNRVY